MDSLVTDAFFLFLKERELATEMEEGQDMTMFLNLSVVVERSYLARAIVNTLLVGGDVGSRGREGDCAVQ